MNAPTVTGRHQADDRVFVIASSNMWLHVYPDVQTMLDCKDITAAVPGALEFFDLRGNRLAPVFTGGWALEGLRTSGDPADEAAVQRRLCAVMEGIKASVEQRLAEAEFPPGTLEEALSHLPDLNGRNLAECFDLLKTDFGDGRPASGGVAALMTDGSFWHNFWCH